jgi:hypothetical protein
MAKVVGVSTMVVADYDDDAATRGVPFPALALLASLLPLPRK